MIKLHKLYLNLKNSFNNMYGEFIIFKFHTINNIKSLQDDLLFKIDTKLKPFVNNIKCTLLYQILMKIKSDKIFTKTLDLFPNDMLGEIINKASGTNLKRIIDNIDHKNLPKILELLPKQKIEQIIDLCVKENFMQKHKNVEHLDKHEIISVFEKYVAALYAQLINNTPKKDLKKIIDVIPSKYSVPIQKILNMKISNISNKKFNYESDNDSGLGSNYEDFDTQTLGETLVTELF